MKKSLRQAATEYANKHDHYHGMLWVVVYCAFEAGVRWHKRHKNSPMTKKTRYVKIDVQANGRLGGNARAAKLSASKRKAAARKAVNARWAAYRAAKAAAESA